MDPAEAGEEVMEDQPSIRDGLMNAVPWYAELEPHTPQCRLNFIGKPEQDNFLTNL